LQICGTLFVALSPCLFCCGAGVVRNLYIQWFVYTPEDKAYFAEQGESPNRYGGGIPSVARGLMAETEQFDDPEQAAVAHPKWFSHRFRNGDWIFGYGVDGHGYHVGHGTLVVKDSRGRSRVFFGHICGENAGFPWGMDHCNGLDDFYKDFVITGLREWFP